MFNDTIFALSTVVGKSGVAIIRISGNKALKVIKDFGVEKLIKPQQAIFCRLFSPIDKELLDEAIVLYFKAPGSFTGEDVIELHIHGSFSVVKDTIAALNTLKYLRLAEPGEFSKRAFFNGKMDLTQAEGLVQLIESETSLQRKVALRQMEGGLGSLYENWRKKLISILAYGEAYIDFPEDDLSQSMLKELLSQIKDLSTEIQEHINKSISNEIISYGIKVAIVGAPNVGKSSLMNLLAKREVAIVADVAGTTRDVIEVRVDLNGYPTIFYDTAGVRQTDDLLESEGVRRAKKAAEESDIIIKVLAPHTFDESDVALEYSNKPLITVLNKIDLLPPEQVKRFTPEGAICISASHNLGIEELMAALSALIAKNYSFSADSVVIKLRYKENLKECIDYLNEFDLLLPLDIGMEYIRLAASSIGAITGKIEVEDVLDEIFSSFCIGK